MLVLEVKSTVKQRLATIRMLFDWLVTGQVIPVNPAHAVRGPKRVVKTPVRTADEIRTLPTASRRESETSLKRVRKISAPSI